MGYILSLSEKLYAKKIYMPSFMKIKPSQNSEITLSFTDIDIGKSCPSCKFLMSQIGLKIKFVRKFPNLQLLT